MKGIPFLMDRANILIVDDTPANLRLLAGILKERGYRILPVTSGQAALEIARKSPPDLILLDINMPGMNGYEVCAELKSDEKLQEIPIIFISAINETIDKVKAFSIGGVDYITKPFHIKEVIARVETHLHMRHLTIELEKHNLQLEEME
jgi:DNA-binding response OmpR family regulator